jgi:hypothetical protein
MLKFISVVSGAILTLSAVSYSAEGVLVKPSEGPGLFTSKALNLRSEKELVINRFRGRCAAQRERNLSAIADVQRYINEAQAMYNQAMVEAETNAGALLDLLDRMRVNFRESSLAISQNKESIELFRKNMTEYLAVAAQQGKDKLDRALAEVQNTIDEKKADLGELLCAINEELLLTLNSLEKK